MKRLTAITPAFVLVMMLSITSNCFGNSEQITPKQAKKIENVKSIGKKLALYRKYLRKDSLARFKQANKLWKKRLDSLFKLKPNTNNSLAVPTILKEGSTTIESIDSAIHYGSNHVNTIDSATISKFIEARIEDPRVDEVNGLLQTEKMPTLERQAERITSEERKMLDKELSRVEEMKVSLSEFKDIRQNSDSLQLKQLTQKYASEGMMHLLSQEAASNMRAKLSELFRKFSVVPNSNDLSTAVKRNSLQGKAVRDRIYMATNFQFISLSPFSVDLSPSLGYRWTGKLVTGVTGMARVTFADTLEQLSSSAFGIGAFANYELINSYFVYGEYQMSTPGNPNPESQADTFWESGILVGVGKKFRIHPRLETTIMVVYRIGNNDQMNSVYEKPFQVKVGFQTSSLGFHKKRG